MMFNIVALSTALSAIVFLLGKTRLGFLLKASFTIAICFGILSYVSWTSKSGLRSIQSMPQTVLLNDISKIARSNGLDADNIYVGHLDSFRYSPINAQSLYIDLKRSIVFSDALFSENSDLKLSSEAMISLMYHEVFHHKHNDIIKIYALYLILLSVSIVFMSILEEKLSIAKYIKAKLLRIFTEFSIKITIFSMLISIATLITLYQQRITEYNADVYSLSQYPNKKAFSEFIEKSSYGQGQRKSMMDVLFSTHPSKYNRLSVVKTMGEQQSYSPIDDYS